jgi:hypothetical protein
MGQYYEYDGSVDVDAKGLTIGGYKSAFSLKNTVELMFDTLFDGLYRDGGLLECSTLPKPPTKYAIGLLFSKKKSMP